MGLTTDKTNLEPQSAPICMVPPEILSHIFELAHREVLKTPSWRFRLAKGCPNTSFANKIARVSRLFRDIAVNTSTLWTVIHVHGIPDGELDHVRTYLKRSGNSLLSVTLHLFGVQDPRGTTIAPMLTLIQANMYRLQQLKADFDDLSIPLHAMRHLTQPAPQLTTLHLSNFTARGAILSDTPPPFFANQTNKLTELQLCMVPISWSQSNFKNLVVFSLRGYTRDLSVPFEEFWAIIENSPSLCKLDFENSGFLLPQSSPLESDVQQQPCLLNSLQELRLAILPPNIASTLLSRLHAPNLQVLALLSITQGDGLLNLVEGPPVPFPNLTSLNIDGVFVNDKTVVNRLHRAYPRLHRWDFSNESSDISLFATSKNIEAEE